MKLFVLFALGALALLAFSNPTFFLTNVEAGRAPEETGRDFENYDIRIDSSGEAIAKLSALRGTIRRDLQPDRTADANAKFKIEYNEALGVAEIVSRRGTGTALTIARTASRAKTLTDFLKSNSEIFRISTPAQLHKTADYTNPDGNLSFVHFEQRIGEIPVFAAELKAGFSRRNEMFRVINSLAPGIDPDAVSSDFASPDTAVIRAAAHINVQISANDLTRQDSSKAKQVEFHTPAFTDKVLAERFYFPIGNGVVRPAWRVLFWTKEAAYYVVVDSDGTLLWRKNITAHQVLPATYNVYGNIFTSLMQTADSPSPFTPGCTAPTGCTQPSAIPRMNFTLIGNESPYTFNNLGWIPDTGLPVRPVPNANITDGNNLEAGIDRDGTQGVDNDGWAFGNPTRVFSYAYNPAPGNPMPGEEPLPTGGQTYPPSAFQQGVITHGFYTINRWHDEMYRFGFNEQARNFQHFNFGRGGSEGDRISFEMQDSSGTNGANLAVGADGLRPRLQMFIWTFSTPDRDGALDSQTVLHEMTHGLSGRLHGNVSGLNSNMSRGTGEGWSDFYALALLSEPADNPLGTYTVSGYITAQLTPTYESNYYYGLRRFPVAVRASLGPNGLPHNPLTFRYVNNDCNTLIGTTTTNPNSAYPRGPLGSTTCDQIHNLGELWSNTLWEVRNQLIGRHFAFEGNRRVLQYVTDGMKLSPLNPTMLQSRDSIMSAAAFSDPGDVPAVTRGFAIRGMGLSASIQNTGSGNNNTVVTEAFDLPQLLRRPARADFDGDGRSDVSVFRPSDRNWYLDRSTTGFAAVNWGIATDKPIAGDFDGDGKADFTVFRASADGASPDYYTLLSATSTVSYISWGVPGDIPLTEDFDGDNKADHTIFRPSAAQFWVRRSTDGSILISRPYPGTTPLVGDFDGDGRGDFATFSGGQWLISRSQASYSSGEIINWGTSGDKAVPADYDGDGKDDIAVYRPSNGTWYIVGSAVGIRYVNFGISTDTPVPADYDGDARADIAVFRSGIWYINRSTGGVVITSFGLSGDVPIPATFVP